MISHFFFTSGGEIKTDRVPLDRYFFCDPLNRGHADYTNFYDASRVTFETLSRANIHPPGGHYGVFALTPPLITVRARGVIKIAAITAGVRKNGAFAAG